MTRIKRFLLALWWAARLLCSRCGCPLAVIPYDDMEYGGPYYYCPRCTGEVIDDVR